MSPQLLACSLGAIAIAVLSTTTSFGQSTQGVIRALPTNCILYDNRNPQDYQLSTDIPCVHGLLHGSGTLNWLSIANGMTWHETLTASTGVVLQQGRYTAVVDPASIQARITRCDGGEINTEAIVPDSLALNFGVVIDAVLAHDKALKQRECDSKLKAIPSRSHIDVYQQSYRPIFGQTSGSRSFVGTWDARGTLTRQVNFARDAFWNNVRAQFRREQELAREAARVENLRRESQARLERRNDLAKRTVAFEVVALADIQPNPFLWQGKAIGACVRFDQMVGPTTARITETNGFTVAAVVGVPTTRFRSPGIVFLVARVSGQNNGTMILRYATAIDQSDGRCSDFIDP